MGENIDTREIQKKRTRDALEETFKRYEPKEETSPFTTAAEETRRTHSVEKAPETLASPTEIPSPKTINTGITGLDAVLGGGITDCSLILVSGEIGSHYETFVQQILYNHAIENGKTAYYLAETLSMDIQQEMNQFSWNLKDYINTNNWAFINLRTKNLQQLADLSPKIPSDNSNVQLTQGLNNLKTDLLNKIKEKKWTTLELSHLLQYYDLKEVIDLMLYWRAAIRIHGGIHFAILPLDVHPENHVNTLKNVADAVIDFRLREGPHDYETVMTIRKMRHLLKPLMIPFTTQQNGIVVETVARIS